ncbi:MAG: 4Fe-4S binding protein [Atopobiaceae bacterium]|jgi:ferredoxin|nr:4Fe-4S binding protein [Atopobiaceae bacterium]MCI2172684.1 4Fe-4S binding protein [Atopobiaceae bacterium]MCI2206991.1 4Fe-4S binding protein [Atopobiaceae bacterium]
MAGDVLAYLSPSGTTRAVARALSSDLGACASRTLEWDEHDLLRDSPTQEVEVSADVVALFAVPVFAGRVPAPAMDALRRFRSDGAAAVAVVVYGNRAYDDALIELADVLAEQGFHVVAAAAFVAQHSIFPAVAHGRPDEADLAAVEAFAHAAAPLAGLVDGTPMAKGTAEVPGGRPYQDPKAVPLSPVASSGCISCGACASICPVGAIPMDEPWKTDADACIACTACIAVCPKGVRGFAGLPYKAAAVGFAKLNSGRKEPETFLATE